MVLYFTHEAYTLFTMKHEQSTTKRHEWQHYSEEMQLAVETLTESLRPEIEAANLYLAQLYAEDRMEEAGQFSHDAIEEFDNRWKFMGDIFMVAGTWYEPSFTRSDDQVSCHQSIKPAFMSARSRGFTTQFIKLENHEDAEQVPQIGYSFFVGNTTYIPHPAGIITLQPTAFATIDSATLHYMRPGDFGEHVSSDLEEVIERMQRAEMLLEKHVTDAYSKFFKLSAKKQQKFLNQTVQMIDEALPNPNVSEYLAVTFTTPTAYTKNVQEYQLVPALDEDAPLEITGTLLGFTSLNILPETAVRKFTSPDELIDPTCSLLAIVEVADQDFSDEDDRDPDQELVMYIPLRQAHAYDVRPA